jgi:hypothetical protein
MVKVKYGEAISNVSNFCNKGEFLSIKNGWRGYELSTTLYQGRLSDRQAESENRATTDFTLDIHSGAVKLHYPLGDGKTQAGPIGCIVIRRIRSVVPVEDVGKIFLTHTFTSVSNFQD